MTGREQILREIRLDAGFDDHPGFTESVEICLWLMAKEHNKTRRQKCAAMFRRILIELPAPRYPH